MPAPERPFAVSHVGLLGDLVDPVPRDQVVARIVEEWGAEVDEARALLDGFLGAHLVQEVGAHAPDQLLASYEDLDVHRMMLDDQVRNEAFIQAIRGQVGPGDRVLDAGSGTGVLAVHAALAGARVVAVEGTTVADVARRVARDNGVEDRVEVRQVRLEDVEVDPPVDLLLSEWLGHFGLWEGVLPTVLGVRDRCLAPGGRLIPSRVSLWLAPLSSPDLARHRGLAFWSAPVAGLDYRGVADVERARLQSHPVRVPASALAAAGQCLGDLDLATVSPTDLAFTRELAFPLDTDRVVDGWAGWFVADLGAGILLDTSPIAPPTHWLQVYFSWDPLPVLAGDRLVVRVTLLPMEAGRRRPPLRLESTLLRGQEVVHAAVWRYDED